MGPMAERGLAASTACSKSRKSALPVKSKVLPHLTLLVLLTGCTVGPDFKVPDPPMCKA
jgi:hypothetical protein